MALNLNKETLNKFALVLLEVAGTVGAPILYQTLEGEEKERIFNRAYQAAQLFIEWVVSKFTSSEEDEAIAYDRFRLAMAQMLLCLGVAQNEVESLVKVSALTALTDYLGSRFQ